MGKDIIELEYKFDKVYYYNKMVSEAYMEKCDYCVKGKMKKPNGEEVICIKCGGSGKIEGTSGSITSEVAGCYLDHITIRLDEYGDMDTDYIFCDENDEEIFGTIYKTKKSAEKNKTKGIMGFSL